MRLREKSIEELLDLEADLRQLIDDEQDGSVSRLIEVERELYRRIKNDKKSEYSSSLEKIKGDLVSNLVRYGTYLKTQYRKDDYVAKRSLQQAISYQKEIPIAHYRLGFLSYKQKQYVDGITYFRNALKYQEQCHNERYKLNRQQLFNGNVYLANSALYIAEEAKSSLKEIESEALMASLPSYKRSSLYDLIFENEKILAENAFFIVSANGKKTVSKEEVDRLVEEALDKKCWPGTLLLYFSDRSHSLIFKGEEVALSINRAEMLRYFFLNTSERSPATKNHFRGILETRMGNDEISTEAFIQSIRRIREKLREVGSSNVIVNKPRPRSNIGGPTEYYYDPIIPYIIIHRTDNTFLLD